MRRIVLASALMFLFSGIAAAEPRDLSGFTRIQASAGVQLQVALGQEFSVNVTGSDAIDGVNICVEVADFNGDRRPDIFLGQLGSPTAHDRLLLNTSRRR